MQFFEFVMKLVLMKYFSKINFDEPILMKLYGIKSILIKSILIKLILMILILMKFDLVK